MHGSEDENSESHNALKTKKLSTLSTELFDFLKSFARMLYEHVSLHTCRYFETHHGQKCRCDVCELACGLPEWHRLIADVAERNR